MTEQKSSAAVRYREIRERRRAEQLANVSSEGLFDVPVSSGMVFKCRKPVLETYVISGLMPMSLTEKLSAVVKAAGINPDADLEKKLTDREAKQTLIFARTLVDDICVEPRIVEAAQTDDEVSRHEVLPEDFKDLVQWGMKNLGGAEAERLGNFRGKPVVSSHAGTRRKKRVKKTK
jgi:hypothetical protein